MKTHRYLVDIEQAHVVNINSSTILGYCQIGSGKKSTAGRFACLVEDLSLILVKRFPVFKNDSLIVQVHDISIGRNEIDDYRPSQTFQFP